jgi:hypothetical protein
MAVQLARQDSSHPLTRPEPALSISINVVRQAIRGWMNKNENTGSLFMHKSRLRAFLEDPLLKESGELLSSNRHQVRIIMGLLTAHCHLKGHVFKLGLVTVPSATDANRHLEQPHTFFVAVRLWSHYMIQAPG